MKCHGKCYLNKKLAKSGESQDSQNNDTGVQIVVDYCEQPVKYSFSCSGGLSLHYSELPDSKLKSEFRTLLFRPPIA